jgi:hypothetical protein
MDGNEYDISGTIMAKSDQLNASDIVGGPITVTVNGVSVNKRSDQPVSISISGGYQPFKPCLTVRRVLSGVWGNDSSKWIGGMMTLYCDESVMWAGVQVGGIRISNLSGISEPQSVTVNASKHKKMQHTVYPLIIELPAYPDDSIRKNESEWIESFNSGASNPSSLINKISQQFTVSTDQANYIMSLANQ